MTLSLTLVLLFISVVAFGLATFNVVVGKLNLVALGLLTWVLSIFIPLLSAKQ